MIPKIAALSTIEIAAPVVVGVVLLTRLYFAPVVFHPRYTQVWNIARRLAAPILQRVVYRFAPFNIQIENQARKEEYVGVVDLTAKELTMRIDGERDVEIPLLSGFKSDWDGNAESGTGVWYCGTQPSGYPKWLKPHQVHFFCFRVGERTRVCAHFEANPWRPDMWMDHLFKGGSFSPPKGVQRMKRALKDADVPLHESDLPTVEN